MIYRFVKKEENIVRIGAIDAAELETVLQTYIDGGYSIATAEEHDAQVIGGASKAVSAESSEAEATLPPTSEAATQE